MEPDEYKGKGYLDFTAEKWQKGYKPFEPTKENLLANIGKKICYVDYVEPHRGTYLVRYGRIVKVAGKKLYLTEDLVNYVHLNKIIEMGIETQPSEANGARAKN